MTNMRRRDVARRAARWLALAAAPAFAVMALHDALRPVSPLAALCGAEGGPGGMAAMYLLMAVFHLPAWLTALSPAWQAGTARAG